MIDADALKKYIDDCKCCEKCTEKGFNCNDNCELPDFLTKQWERIIDEQSTIDAVPVIQCKDCKHYYEREWIVGGGSYTTCWYQTIANAQPNDFCSRAERRNDENN